MEKISCWLIWRRRAAENGQDIMPGALGARSSRQTRASLEELAEGPQGRWVFVGVGST